MMKKLPVAVGAWILSLVVSVLLAACASKPLEEAPVTDRAAGVPAAPGAAPSPARTGVVPLTAAAPSQGVAGPSGAARIVYFDYDSFSIRPEFQSLLDTHARYLGTNRERKLTIAGHTDERGGREYNLALGQQRADAVRRALQLLGVPPTQVETISFGEEKPARPGHEEAAWSQNRRAELAYR